MERSEIILRHVSSQAFERPPQAAEPGRRPFVTISRQAGAGGRSLAAALLECFARRGVPELSKWEWADRRVCEGLATDPRLGISVAALLDERFRGRIEDYLAQALCGTAPQLKVYHALFATMRSLAAVGRVILVGRGGTWATRGYVGGVHVRLVGSRGARVERVAVQNSWGRAQAGRWVDEQDKERAALAREYFSASSDDPLCYDAVLNTDHLPVADAAEAVAELALARSREPVRA